MFFENKEFAFERSSGSEGFECKLCYFTFLAVSACQNVSHVLNLVFHGRDISRHGGLFVPTQWILHGNSRELLFYKRDYYTNPQNLPTERVNRSKSCAGSMKGMGKPSKLGCSRCSQEYPPDQLKNLCDCGAPLLVHYDLASVRSTWRRDSLKTAVDSMWRYAPVLPADLAEAVTLSEGWTPLVRADALGANIGARNLWVKDEARNPTDSFKARGLCCAVTMAHKLGARKLAIPSAGNAAGALAAYAAAAGLEAHIFMPQDVPEANFLECEAFGADVTLVDGLISDCGRIVGERKAAEGWFEVSTLKEPYRIEGKKTMGYEVAEQFDWELPDAIL
jgi:hypothetical protein